ncbi:hypothetical protein C8A01DRAFT_34321 [Parachaetomium inaequale]|uniref:Uncharacterized protein n=1 Tax=Parachaetomium inaequale TaxID=2588326 RepID=A0AAN6PIX4_9PEZI|nr:hypothetical protein C8A01DRAFT_34321 [Parachaetomium inaequale]
MLVIRVLWLQAALAAAQLLDLNGLLGGGDGAGTSAVEGQGAAETTSPGGSVDGAAGNNAAAGGGLLDPLLDPIIGPTGLLGNNDAVVATTAAEAQDPPAATSAELAPDPEPTQVEPAETAAPEPTAAPEATPEPTTQEPAPATEQAPPAPTEDQSPPAEEQQQPTLVPVPVPVPEASTAPAAAPAPATSAAAAPVASSSNAGVVPVPNPVATSSAGQTAAPAPSTSTPAQSAGQQPATGEQVRIPITASGTTFMSVFVPPSPTGRVAVIDGADNNLNTNPSGGGGGQTGTSPNNNPNESDTTLSDNPAGNANTALTGAGPGTDLSNPTAEKGIQSADTSGLSLPTKIGIGVGAGAGTVLLVVVLILVLWKRRMGRGPPSVMGGDSERGGATPTPQEKAKMDWESEHDVAFDFGGFFRERAQGGGGEGKTTTRGKLVVVNGADEVDRLPAFETSLQQHQRQRSVAELDGGEVAGYRGVVGVGR